MSVDPPAVQPGPPVPYGWEFGDAPYTLEPLWLPEPGPIAAPEPEPDEHDLIKRLHRRLAEPAPAGSAAAELCQAASTEALFWFRWITGHQVSFILWRLMARSMDALADPDPDADESEVLRDLAGYVRAYGSMLLYTSSAPRARYEALIRPSMALQHPGFSGSWAPDYPPVRDVLRGRRLSVREGAAAEELRAAVKNVQLVHADVAARLVPNGTSLLQLAAAANVPGANRPDRGVLYDNYFVVLRGPVTLATVLTQLLRRLSAVALDLGAQGLYPEPDPEAGPDALADATAAAYERSLPDVLAQIARQAAGLLPEAAGTH